jgi:negative regulator of flagellin synthesis FlgM
MKVENTHTHRLAQTQAEASNGVEKSSRAAENEIRASSLSGKDQASFSERARLLAKMRTRLEETPDVRSDLVSNLKDKIASGNYEVPIQELVKRLIDRLKPD